VAFWLDNPKEALDGMVGVHAHTSLHVAAAVVISLNLLRGVLDFGEDAAPEHVGPFAVSTLAALIELWVRSRGRVCHKVEDSHGSLTRLSL
jgi:hypothetical protein